MASQRKRKAAVPNEILTAMDAAGSHGSVDRWLRSLPDDQSESFRETCRLYLERRASGATGLSYDRLHVLLVEHFGFPFRASSSRLYLERTFPNLFAQQKRAW